MPAIVDTGSANTVVVLDRRTVSSVQVVSRPVAVAGVGVQGPAGPAGASGAGYTHTQSAPASQWTINHNLGFNPAVDLFNVGGLEMEAEVLHTSPNQTVVSFLVPTAGIARLA